MDFKSFLVEEPWPGSVANKPGHTLAKSDMKSNINCVSYKYWAYYTKTHGDKHSHIKVTLLLRDHPWDSCGSWCPTLKKCMRLSVVKHQ